MKDFIKFIIIVALVAGSLIYCAKLDERNTTHSDSIGKIVDILDKPNVKQMVVKIDGEIEYVNYSKDFYYLHKEELEIGSCVLMDVVTVHNSILTPDVKIFKSFVACP